MSSTKRPSWVVFDFLGVIMPFGVGSVRSFMGSSRDSDFDSRVVEVIRVLHAKGYKIGLASNSRRRWVLPALQKAGINTLFDAIITPDDNVVKPEQEFYDLIIVRTKADASKIVFIDDRFRNMRAAQDRGLSAIQFSTYEALLKDLASFDIKIPATS